MKKVMCLFFVIVSFLLYANIAIAICGGDGDEYGYFEDVEYTNATFSSDISDGNIGALITERIVSDEETKTKTYKLKMYEFYTYNLMLRFIKTELYKDNPDFYKLNDNFYYFEGKPILLLNDDCGHIFWTRADGDNGQIHRLIMFESKDKFPYSRLKNWMEVNSNGFISVNDLKKVISDAIKKFPPEVKKTTGVIPLENVGGYTLITNKYHRMYGIGDNKALQTSGYYIEDGTNAEYEFTFIEFEDSSGLANTLKDYIKYKDTKTVDNNLIYFGGTPAILNMFWVFNNTILIFGPKEVGYSESALRGYDTPLIRSYLEKYPSQFNKFVSKFGEAPDEKYGKFRFRGVDEIHTNLNDQNIFCKKDMVYPDGRRVDIETSNVEEFKKDLEIHAVLLDEYGDKDIEEMYKICKKEGMVLVKVRLTSFLNDCMAEVKPLLENSGLPKEGIEGYALSECEIRRLFYQDYNNTIESYKIYFGQSFTEFFDDLWGYRNKELVEVINKGIKERKDLCENTDPNFAKPSYCYEANAVEVEEELIQVEDPLKDTLTEKVVPEEPSASQSIQEENIKAETPHANILSRIIDWIKSIFS